MFHVLLQDGKIRAEEYEEPYRYSTYTGGGGYWNGVWVRAKDCLGDNPNYRMIIFETKAAAETIAKSFNESMYNDKETIAVPLFKLEDYLK